MFAWLTAGTLLLAAPALKDDRKVKPPVGRFTIERWEIDGVVQIRKDLSDYVMRHSERSVTLERFGADVKTEAAKFFEIGGVQQVDFRSDDRAVVKKAIWKLEGDTLTICEAEPGAERPTDYTATKGSKRTLFVLKRIKE